MIIIAGVHVIKRIGLEMNPDYSLTQLGTVLSGHHTFDILTYLYSHPYAPRSEIAKGISANPHNLHYFLRRMCELRIIEKPDDQQSRHNFTKKTMNVESQGKYQITERGRRAYDAIIDTMDKIKQEEQIMLTQQNKFQLKEEIA